MNAIERYSSQHLFCFPDLAKCHVYPRRAVTNICSYHIQFIKNPKSIGSSLVALITKILWDTSAPGLPSGVRKYVYSIFFQSSIIYSTDSLSRSHCCYEIPDPAALGKLPVWVHLDLLLDACVMPSLAKCPFPSPAASPGPPPPPAIVPFICKYLLLSLPKVADTFKPQYGHLGHLYYLRQLHCSPLWQVYDI